MVPMDLAGQILVYEDHSIPAGAVNTMCFSSDNRFLACGTEKGEVIIWDLETQRILHSLRHGGAVNSVLIDSKSRYVVSGGDNRSVVIWDLYSGEKHKLITEYKGRINHIAISRDEQILSVAGSRKEIYLFQFPGGTLAGMLRNGHGKEVIFSAFDRGGGQLVSIGKDNQMIFWDTGNKRVLRKSDISPNTINASGIELKSAGITAGMKVVVAYQETRLAKGGRSMIFRYNTAVYDWQSGMLENIIEGNVKNIESLSITPDGKYYITDNSTLRLKKINFWDIQLGTVVKNQQIDADLSSIAISGQGDRLALAEEPGSGSGGVKVYRLSGLGPPPGQAATAQYESPTQQYSPTADPSNAYEQQAADYVPSMKPGQVGLPENVDVSLQGKYYALLIGINDYDDPMINDLDAPLTDAQNLYSILASSYSFAPEDILLLKNPTRAEIIDALDRLERTVRPEDNLLIFYAGHGHWDENTHKGYWLPSDAHHESTANWLRNSSLTGYIASIPSKHTLLIADACFAGSIFKTRAAFPQATRAVQRLYDIPSRKAMTSGTLKEVPDESVFLKYLMKRLAENELDYLPSEQLFYSLKPAVLNNSNNVPQFGEVKDAGDEGGDFIFVKKK
jgi:WD40 repeat protein